MLLEARGLACRRGGRLVFADLAFVLEAGDALVLRGPNGSGKSSLLRVLAGFVRPAAGNLAWPAAEGPPPVHYVGHLDAVKPMLTVRENLAFAAGLASASVNVEAGLAALGIADLGETLGRFLSAGQRRRVALARLVAATRPVWLLDEPGVGLDRASRERLEGLIARHRAAGGACVVATHGDVAVADPLVLDFGG